MKNKDNNYFITIFLFLILFYIVLYPKEISSAAIISFNVFIKKVAPSIFPFMVIISVLNNYKFSLPTKLENLSYKLFKLNGSAFSSALISFFCGFPMGGKTAADELNTGNISISQLPQYLCLSLNASPAFIISAMSSSMLNCQSYKYVVLFSTLIANMLCAAVCSLFSYNQNAAIYSLSKNSPDFIKAVSFSIESSTSAIIKFAGYIVVFGVFSKILELSRLVFVLSNFVNIFIKTNTSYINSIFTGLFEITNGINLLSSSNSTFITKLITSTFLLNFGGLSVNMQVLSFLKQYNINIFYILKIRFICALLSSLFCLLALSM